MSQTNSVFILTLAIIGVGFFLKKYNFITEKEGKTISKFLMHTTFPALMIVSTARVKLDTSLFLIPLFCIIFCTIMIAVAWIWFTKYPNDLRGVLTMGAGGLNVGLFGFPIIEGLFGKEAMVYAVMFDIGNTIMTFGVVYPIGSYFSANHKGLPEFGTLMKKIFRLPPVLGMVIGLLINVSDIEMPTLFFDFLDTIAKANKALVLLLMGIYLSFELNKKQMIAISKVLVIRYAVGILFVLGIYFSLSHDSLLYAVLIVCVMLPSGMTILPFSDELNYDSRIAGTLVNISLLISFVLMWGLVLGLHLN
ncbi:AEC family transporter [Emticicia sp. W12TSBA100-4]|uniref:AEC family transporter n=1 Tax=Emticicia sp. W12TSBA100-4 TaxID=3160965 RepID=UPI003305E264